jgi:hypothetical protein
VARKGFDGSRPVSLVTVVPARLAQRHFRRCRLHQPSHSSSTFLRSLRSLAVTPLPRYYGRSDSCPPDSVTLKFNACSTCGQVSLIHALSLPTIPSPTICGSSASSGHATPRRVEPRLLPYGNSELRHSLAGSLLHTDRIEFVILRTGRSPPVASHHASRRDLALQRDRSYVRLRVASPRSGLPPLRPIALSGALAAALRRHVAR